MNTEAKQQKTGRPLKTAGDRKVTRAFAALESEFAIWEQKAATEGRPFSQWVRMRLLAMDARDEQQANRFPNSIVGASDEKA